MFQIPELAEVENNVSFVVQIKRISQNAREEIKSSGASTLGLLNE